MGKKQKSRLKKLRKDKKRWEAHKLREEFVRGRERKPGEIHKRKRRR